MLLETVFFFPLIQWSHENSLKKKKFNILVEKLGAYISVVKFDLVLTILINDHEFTVTSDILIFILSVHFIVCESLIQFFSLKKYL